MLVITIAYKKRKIETQKNDATAWTFQWNFSFYLINKQKKVDLPINQ